MKKGAFRYYPLYIIIGIWLIFSSPFFLKGLVPYPSLYQANFFSPWSAYGFYQGPIKNNAMPDVITQIYPWKKYSIDMLKAGSIPLWNPFSFSGTPHLANYQSAVFFPLNLIFFLPLSFLNAWSILVLLQPLVVGLSMYLFLKSFKLPGSSSVLGSVSFMFCGFIVTWMSYGTLGYAIAFLPLALYSINKFYENPGTRYLLLLAFTIPLSLFAGHFQTSIYFLVVVLAYILFVALKEKNKKNTMILMLYFLSGILISMPQVLPSIEFYLNSVRQDIMTKLEVIPTMYISTILAPDFYGNPVTRNDWFGHYAEWNGYSGIVPAILAVFGALILLRRDRRVLFFLLLGIFSFFLAFDTPINTLLFNLKLPVLSTSASSRIIVLLSFSISTLAAFGLFPLINFVKKTTIKKLVAFLLVILLAVLLLWSIPLLKLLGDFEKNSIAQSNLMLPTLIFLTFLSCVVFLFLFRKRRVAVVAFVALLIGITSFDMLRFAKKWQPFDPAEHVFKDSGVADFYIKNKSEKRYLGGFTAENSVYYGIQELGGYDPLYPARYGEFVRFVELGRKEQGERSLVRFPYRSDRSDKALNFLGVNYLPQKKSDSGQVWAFPIEDYKDDRFEIMYEDEAYRVFKNKEAFPRAFIVSDYIVEQNETKILEKMFDEKRDLQKIAILEKDPGYQKTESPDFSLEITSYKPQKVDIEVETDEESLLVLTDNFYPGWKAFVNNQEKEIFRTNYSFRGIVVPGGKSSVQFLYAPNSFRYGVYLALLGLSIIFISAVLYNKKGVHVKN